LKRLKYNWGFFSDNIPLLRNYLEIFNNIIDLKVEVLENIGECFLKTMKIIFVNNTKSVLDLKIKIIDLMVKLLI